MITSSIAISFQADPALQELLGRIATAQTVSMWATVVLTLLAIAAAVVSYRSIKAMDRTVSGLEKLVNDLLPRAGPLLDSASSIADDASVITDTVRRRVTDVLDTVDDANLRLRSATDAVEQRVRAFGAVLDVVQQETEGILLSAASTARGIHTAAQTLSAPRSARQGRITNDKASEELES